VIDRDSLARDQVIALQSHFLRLIEFGRAGFGVPVSCFPVFTRRALRKLAVFDGFGIDDLDVALSNHLLDMLESNVSEMKEVKAQ
jgi:hypothetical protein